MTLCLSLFKFPTDDKFVWSEVGQGLVRPNMVVGVFPLAQLAIEEGHLIGVGVHLIELFVVRAMRTLHVGIEFG